MKELTKRQQQVLDYISTYQSKHGFSPTYQEVADHFGMASKFGVVRHVEALIQKGYLQKSDAAARSFRVIHEDRSQETYSDDMVNIPVVGRVAAGSPIFAEGNVESWLPLPRQLLKRKSGHFSVRVQGDSMVNAGIFDGDLVVVQHDIDPPPGTIVVALIDGEVTVKRLRVKNGMQYLQAENPDYPDIHPQDEWQIQGRVVTLIRESIQ